LERTPLSDVQFGRFVSTVKAYNLSDLPRSHSPLL